MPNRNNCKVCTYANLCGNNQDFQPFYLRASFNLEAVVYDRLNLAIGKLDSETIRRELFIIRDPDLMVEKIFQCEQRQMNYEPCFIWEKDVRLYLNLEWLNRLRNLLRSKFSH